MLATLPQRQWHEQGLHFSKHQAALQPTPTPSDVSVEVRVRHEGYLLKLTDHFVEHKLKYYYVLVSTHAQVNSNSNVNASAPPDGAFLYYFNAAAVAEPLGQHDLSAFTRVQAKQTKSHFVWTLVSDEATQADAKESKKSSSKNLTFVLPKAAPLQANAEDLKKKKKKKDDKANANAGADASASTDPQGSVPEVVLDVGSKPPRKADATEAYAAWIGWLDAFNSVIEDLRAETPAPAPEAAPAPAPESAPVESNEEKSVSRGTAKVVINLLPMTPAADREVNFEQAMDEAQARGHSYSSGENSTSGPESHLPSLDVGGHLLLPSSSNVEPLESSTDSAPSSSGSNSELNPPCRSQSPSLTPSDRNSVDYLDFENSRRPSSCQPRDDSSNESSATPTPTPSTPAPEVRLEDVVKPLQKPKKEEMNQDVKANSAPAVEGKVPEVTAAERMLTPSGPANKPAAPEAAQGVSCSTAATKTATAGAQSKQKSTRAKALFKDFNMMHTWWVIIALLNVVLFSVGSLLTKQTTATCFFFATVMIRQELFLIPLYASTVAFYQLMGRIPAPETVFGSKKWGRVLAKARREIKYYHWRAIGCIGGAHVGCGLSGVAWLVYYIVGDLHPEFGLNDLVTITAILALSFTSLSVFSAYPAIRIFFHDYFEFSHRLCGWTTLCMNILHFTVKALRLSGYATVLVQPGLWLLLVLASFAVWPWLRSQKLKVVIDVPIPQPTAAEADAKNSKPLCAVVKIPDTQAMYGWWGWGAAGAHTATKMSKNFWEWHPFACAAEPPVKGKLDLLPSAADRTIATSGSTLLKDHLYRVRLNDSEVASKCKLETNQLKPLDRGFYYHIIARAGDWTTELIDRAMTEGTTVQDNYGVRKRMLRDLYVRRYKLPSYSQAVFTYKRVVVCATGGGIAGVVPLIADQLRSYRSLLAHMQQKKAENARLLKKQNSSEMLRRQQLRQQIRRQEQHANVEERQEGMRHPAMSERRLDLKRTASFLSKYDKFKGSLASRSAVELTVERLKKQQQWQEWNAADESEGSDADGDTAATATSAPADAAAEAAPLNVQSAFGELSASEEEFLMNSFSPWLHIVWACRDARVNYREVYETIHALPANQRMIIDTKLIASSKISPMLPRLVYSAVARYKADAVICISGPELTNIVCDFVRNKGVPAYGPVFDS